MKGLTVYLASDHAGFKLKNVVAKYLIGKGYTVIDIGPDSYDPNDDYPDFVSLLTRKLVNDSKSLGIIFGGSGQGEAMAANRVKGIRAAVYYGGSHRIIKLSRQHNNANVLSIGARFVTENQAKRAILVWLSTAFSNAERHVRRLAKVDK